MNRPLVFLLTIVLCGITSAFADDNVRAAQSRLKEGGFYFGEVNGVYSSDTAAAVTRYQIRNGLQISGQLDPATAKALGVATTQAADAATSPSPITESETWRRLRKSDKQFLENLNAGNLPPPNSKSAAPSPAPPPATAPAAAGSPYESTLILSKERLRDYVGAFVLAGLDPQIGSELEFFAERVNYFDEGVVAHERIQSDLENYAQRWPDRRFWLAGEVKVEPQANSRLRVTFPLRYELRKGSKRSSGRVIKTLLLEVTADDLQIVAVNERKAK